MTFPELSSECMIVYTGNSFILKIETGNTIQNIELEDSSSLSAAFLVAEELGYAPTAYTLITDGQIFPIRYHQEIFSVAINRAINH